MFKRDCDVFTFFTLLFHIIKEGVYSNDHLNISHPMHGGGGGRGLTDKTNHFTTKFNIYTDNTLIRQIILSKNFFWLS